MKSMKEIVKEFSTPVLQTKYKNEKTKTVQIQDEVRTMLDDFIYRTRTQDVKTLDEQDALISSVIDDFVALLVDGGWYVPNESLEELEEHIEMCVMNEVTEIVGELES